MAKKKLIKPRIFQQDEEWWMEYEGHATNEVYISQNGRWACAIFRLQDSIYLIVTNHSSLVLRFPAAVPLMGGVSNFGVAATVEYGAGGEKRLCFFYPDGAMAQTEPIKELQQTDRIFFDRKYSEVNLLSEGRILNSVHFGDLEATLIPNVFLYKRDIKGALQLIASILIFVGIVAALVFFHH